MERLVGKYGKKVGYTVVLDRCNVTAEDRAYWRSLAFDPTTWCIFFDTPVEECKWRITRRKNHPTVQGSGGGRIVDGVHRNLERPDQKKEKFGKLITIRSIGEANSILEEWGAGLPQGVEDLEPNITKFVRTRHLLSLGSATRDDLIMNDSERSEFFGKEVWAEEKVDGANMGISIKNNKLVTQNRSHYVTSSYHSQFKKLDYWIQNHTGDLWDILEGERYILYGEWLYATHSIHYTWLPNWFIAFDMKDRYLDTFVSRTVLEEKLKGTTIPIVPVLFRGVIKNEQELKKLVTTKSNFYDGPVEGLYVRWFNEKTKTVERGKVVRSNFQSGNKHWSSGSVTPNELAHE